MHVKHISGTRGHMIVELTDGRYVYVPGELTQNAKFYALIGGDWYWARESVRNSVLPDGSEFLGFVTDGEKEELMRTIRADYRPGGIEIIFD